MRVAIAVMLVLSAGCDAAVGASDAGTDACVDDLATLRVCIYDDESSTSTLGGGSVTLRRDEADVPWLMQASDDGCTEERVEPGTWEYRASDASGTCVTPFMPLELRPCERVELRAEVIDYCVDG